MKMLHCLPVVLILAACAAGKPSVRGTETAALPAVPVLSDPNGGRDPAYSPDGQRIAFLSSTLHTPADLWVMSADGSGKRRLTTRGVRSFGWSRDGRSIRVVARRKGYDEVFSVVVDAKGKQAEERIPGLPPGSGIPVDSPDGKLFAFIAPGEQGVRDLWIGTADRTRIEPITDKISVREVFWSGDGRKVYYEAGKTYGVGVWEVDLATMESRPVVNKYVGTPVYSPKADRVAYAYPTDPGRFEVRTMRLDGSEVVSHKASRLSGRWLAWDADGKAVLYLAQDAGAAVPDNTAKENKRQEKKEESPTASPHGSSSHAEEPKSGVTALWRLDLDTDTETRVSPPEVHLVGFSPSPDGRNVVLAGVLEKSPAVELFRMDLGTKSMAKLAESRASSWMPVSAPDAARVAFFTNDGPLTTLKVARYTGEELASYPGFTQEGDTLLFWLPGIDGFAVFSGRGLFAFSEKGPVAFPNREDHRAYLYADVSIQEDKVLISAVPRYGETPGLYLLSVADNAFVQTDLRFPAAPERAAERYLQPRWSLDGRKIAFTDRQDVWTMNADGTGRRRLTDYAEKNGEGAGKPSLPSYPFWSIGGKSLGYTLTVYDGKKVFREIWWMREDGSDRKKIYSEEVDSQFQVFLPEYTFQPFFNTGDDRVILTGVRDGVPDILSIEIGNGRIRRLTDEGAAYPTLLPEEGVIVYTSLAGNEERLRVMNADGTGKRPFLLPPAGRSGGSGK